MGGKKKVTRQEKYLQQIFRLRYNFFNIQKVPIDQQGEKNPIIQQKKRAKNQQIADRKEMFTAHTYLFIYLTSFTRARQVKNTKKSNLLDFQRPPKV